MAAVAVMDALAAFLAAHTASPWVWGESDCCMTPASWAAANGHGDLMAVHRGEYDDEAGALAIVVRRGGVLPMISDGCARIGLLRTDLRVRGVIGVIGSLNTPTRQWGAIWDGERWQVRDPAGFVALTAPALGMWSV
ncbi:hypothetical protein [uncultured Reyranella sp.]|uniref:DUF6950 family protein n=1 Tax=uncultured Reyranella sp. TaxID=735512 RepID=UPI00259D22D4|nr:hypothetical protein [uncultured Reyranella sp.]